MTLLGDFLDLGKTHTKDPVKRKEKKKGKEGKDD